MVSPTSSKFQHRLHNNNGNGATTAPGLTTTTATTRDGNGNHVERGSRRIGKKGTQTTKSGFVVWVLQVGFFFLFLLTLYFTGANKLNAGAQGHR